MITNKQKLSIVYFLSHCFFLASGYSLIFKITGKDSWLSMIIGSIIGIVLILIFNKLSFNKKKNYILNTKTSFIKKIIMMTFFIFILFVNILIVRIFATSFFLTKTPGIVITIPFLLLAMHNAKKGLNSIAKIAEILLPISLTLIILSTIAVGKDGLFTSFLPLITSSKIKIIISSFYYAIFTSIPNLLLFDVKIDTKTHIKSYIFSTVISTLIGTVIIYTLGDYLIKIFRFPEYMVLKQLKLFNFIEKIENLIGLIWFFDLFISASLSIYNIDKITNSNKLIDLLIIGFIVIIIEFVSTNYEYATIIYKNLPILLLIIGLIFFIVIYIKSKKIKKVATATLN